MKACEPSEVLVRRQDIRASWRILVNVIVTMAMFVALFHGLRGTTEAVTPLHASVVASTTTHALPAELPDQQPLGHGAHCAHCLCHVGYHAEATFNATAAEFCGPVYTLGDDRFARVIAGLPPFKPPRA
jgi:hypothetical protein